MKYLNLKAEKMMKALIWLRFGNPHKRIHFGSGESIPNSPSLYEQISYDIIFQDPTHRHEA